MGLVARRDVAVLRWRLCSDVSCYVWLAHIADLLQMRRVVGASELGLGLAVTVGSSRCISAGCG